MNTWPILIIIIVIILIVWWALLRSAKSYKPDFEAHHEEAHTEETPMEAETRLSTVEIAEAPAAPAVIDDLTIIEGIGPKINGLLQAAGITTFAQLADADVERLREILVAADLRFIDPASWGEQSRLAGEGKLDELKVLQGKLRGGRRA